MAHRKYKNLRRKFIKRKVMARRRNPGRRLIINTALHPIPQRFITKMKYSEQISTDASGQYYMNLNSIFDPNRTGAGHQPYGFDTLATLYNRYRVISCGYRIQVNWSGNVTACQPVLAAALPSNEPLTFLSAAEARENPRAKYITQTFGGEAQTLRGKVYIPSLVGRNKAQYMADDRYQALTTGSPQELAILNIITASGGLDTPNSCTLQILMEYTVEFFDIKNLAQSTV